MENQARLCFSMFTAPGEDTVSVSALPDFFRSLGAQISDAECTQICSGFGSDKVGFDEVLPTVSEWMGRSDKKTVTASLTEALRSYDRGTGAISKAQFTQTMTACGEALSTGDVEAILQGISVDGNGNVKTNDVIQKLTTDLN